ncbi:DUF5049 domain-containing protein [Phormidium nigroviride]
MNGESQRTLLKSHPIPAQPATAPGEITLHEWKPGEEWVTHFHNLQDGGYYYGNYFTDLASAEADYEARVQKYLGQTPNSHKVQPILVPAHILEGIKAVRECGTTNMFDVAIAKVQAVALGYPETADWIDSHREDYEQGIVSGFTPQ